ncbi:hypothetical protein [Candidatus Protochlamydia phocaeensis]|uniref:hypothetical protein n=1 Tax=Candidatus Protochlamydia phocaeensis TaxID=1414722 RepID=UPI0008386D55|nr:hypothetical protein [Candidatus Protochlamydia phocaeensis]
MPDRIDLLISILFDNEAREDERHDAVMAMGKFNDKRALNALLTITLNPKEDNIILSSCGESIAQIWIKQNSFDKIAYDQLPSLAKTEAEMYIRNNKPEWTKYI